MKPLTNEELLDIEDEAVNGRGAAPIVLRLLATIDALERERDEAVSSLEDEVNTTNILRAEAAAVERARIVAWHRAEAARQRPIGGYRELFANLHELSADAIERGEHEVEAGQRVVVSGEHEGGGE